MIVKNSCYARKKEHALGAYGLGKLGIETPAVHINTSLEP